MKLKDRERLELVQQLSAVEEKLDRLKQLRELGGVSRLLPSD